jgi:hypothetical protein
MAEHEMSETDLRLALEAIGSYKTDYADLEKRLREGDLTRLNEAADALADLRRKLEERDLKVAEFRGTLEALLRLKDAKDAGFETYVEEEAYRRDKVLAWNAARAALKPTGELLSRDDAPTETARSE